LCSQRLLHGDVLTEGIARSRTNCSTNEDASKAKPLRQCSTSESTNTSAGSRSLIDGVLLILLELVLSLSAASSAKRTEGTRLGTQQRRPNTGTEQERKGCDEDERSLFT
jgi:hypothetical protein